MTAQNNNNVLDFIKASLNNLDKSYSEVEKNTFELAASHERGTEATQKQI